MYTAIALAVIGLAALATLIWKSSSAAKWREQRNQLKRGEAAQEREDAAAAKLRHRALKRAQLRDIEHQRRLLDDAAAAAARLHDASGGGGSA